MKGGPGETMDVDAGADADKVEDMFVRKKILETEGNMD